MSLELCRLALPAYRLAAIYKPMISYHFYYKERADSPRSEEVKNILIRCFNTEKRRSLTQLTIDQKIPPYKTLYPQAPKTIEHLVTERFRIVDAKKGEKSIDFASVMHCDESSETTGKYYIIAVDPTLDTSIIKEQLALTVSRILNYDGLTNQINMLRSSTITTIALYALGYPVVPAMLTTFAIDYLINKGSSAKEEDLTRKFITKCKKALT